MAVFWWSGSIFEVVAEFYFDRTVNPLFLRTVVKVVKKTHQTQPYCCGLDIIWALMCSWNTRHSGSSGKGVTLPPIGMTLTPLVRWCV